MQVGFIMKLFGLLTFTRFWPKLETNFDKIDHWMKCYGFPKHLKMRMQIAFFIFVLLALSKYQTRLKKYFCKCIISVDIVSFDFFVLSHQTNNIFKISLHNYMKLTTRTFFPRQALQFSNNMIVLAIFKFLHFQLLMTVGYTDTFIIFNSVILAARFQQIAKRTKRLIKHNVGIAITN